MTHLPLFSVRSWNNGIYYTPFNILINISVWLFNSASNHYLRKCRVIVNWTYKDKIWRILNKDTESFCQENISENVIWTKSAILY